MLKRFAAAVFLLFLLTYSAKAATGDVVLTDQGATVLLSNGLISFAVNKAAGTINNMTLGNSPNLAGRGAYFAVVNSGGHDGWDVHNGIFKVVRNTPDLMEISTNAPVGHVYFDQHYILRRGESGFYVFVIMHHNAADPRESNGQIRWSFYLNNQLFNYQYATDTEQGKLPDMRGAVQVQDATYRLPDGTVYTKYNYCNYIEEDDVHGFSGSGPGSYGVFIVMPSKEYLQAPTKQDITVHGGPIIHRFLVSGHFEPRELTAQPITGDWTKFCGPWMVYLNKGDSPAQLWSDAKSQFKTQESQWPYSWMQNADYPLVRGDVTGSLKLYDGQHSAANALMVLAAPAPDWQIQTLGYIFSTRADADGNFTLPHVRPGTYTLYAMIPGVTEQYRKDNITVTAGGKVDLGTINFVPAYYSVKLWQIGTATWKAVGFNLSDQPRGYGSTNGVPANLTYTIGKSTPSKDWYFAQAKAGTWKINFDLTKTYRGQGILTVGIAGQTNNPTVNFTVNDKPLHTYRGGNSSAAYRSAILGSSYHETLVMRFPASQLHEGTNTIGLTMPNRGAVQYDVIKLEIDDPNLPKQTPLDTVN